MLAPRVAILTGPQLPAVGTPASVHLLWPTLQSASGIPSEEKLLTRFLISDFVVAGIATKTPSTVDLPCCSSY